MLPFRVNLDRWEVVSLILSLLLMVGREFFFWMGLPNLLSPFFAFRNASYSLLHLRIQRDELLRSRSMVAVVDPIDTVSYYPVEFKGFCRLLETSSPYYPERLSLQCDTIPAVEDLVWAVGLVGRVIGVRHATAEVLTIHSKEFYIKVIDVRSGVWGTLKGDRSPSVRFLPHAADVKVGDTLVAYDHPGVVVGTVKAVIPEDPFVKLEVAPLWRYYVWSDFALLKPLY
ncbi:MAG: hypothetical protein GXO39_02585 [Thermotogae bacterium]|nr:hypothetical protein [Thermotogota bacterium]